MKICYLFSNFHLSHLTGQPGMAYKIAGKAAEKGNKVYLVSNSKGDKKFVDDRIELFLIKGDGDFKSYLFNIFNIINYLKKIRPDILHAHGHLFLIYAWFISRLLGIPCICSVCEILDEKTFSLSFFTGLLRKLMFFCLKRSEITFVTSDFIKNSLINKGVPSQKIKVVRIGLDEKFLLNNEHLKPDTDVLYYGDANMERGFGIILELARRLPGLKFMVLLRFVNNAFKEKLDEMKSLSNVIVRHYPYSEKLADILLKSKLIVLPYRWMSMRPPITLLESMALGKCVVTSTLEGNDEIINKKNGVIANFEKLDEAAAEINSLIGNDSLRESMGKAAREAVKDMYSSSEYDKIISFY